jgi:4-aminobutyrate aminotransferase-like enzyme
MKPKHIGLDTTLTAKKMSIETPIGITIESDSGNHYLDLLSIIVVIGVLYVGKKLIDKKIK